VGGLRSISEYVSWRFRYNDASAVDADFARDSVQRKKQAIHQNLNCNNLA
jgi:hypothetical protein